MIGLRLWRLYETYMFLCLLYAADRLGFALLDEYHFRDFQDDTCGNLGPVAMCYPCPMHRGSCVKAFSNPWPPPYLKGLRFLGFSDLGFRAYSPLNPKTLNGLGFLRVFGFRV